MGSGKSGIDYVEHEEEDVSMLKASFFTQLQLTDNLLEIFFPNIQVIMSRSTICFL